MSSGLAASKPDSKPESSKPESSKPDGSSKDTQVEAEEGNNTQCPICAFIEAGACKEQHQVWTACREAAKKEGVDYVDACQDQFKTFLQCAIDNADYYDPFLSMLLGDEEDEELKQAQGKGSGAEAGSSS